VQQIYPDIFSFYPCLIRIFPFPCLIGKGS